ncbi:lysine histidine transporter-like 8 [Carya illinoinensis]|nr:lysine histidine transporter-like 8 [Carya illinoinensis]
MSEPNEIRSAPLTPRPRSAAPTPPVVLTPPVSCPPSQFHSPSLSRSPLLHGKQAGAAGVPRNKTPKTPRTPLRLSLTPRFITPLGSPMRKALRMTKLDPQDAWLPITESRNGNQYYAAFHTLCSGIGVQALVLPVAFKILGWTWGIIGLTLAFIWQLYTLWVLVQLHESTETGMRYSRYQQLSCATFGEKLGTWLAMFPIMYLSGGTCMALIIIGGSTTKQFYQIVCGPTCSQPLTTVEWYLVFTCAAVLLSQLPNLNSIAGVSLIGAVTAVAYCTLIWVVSVAEGRLSGVSYDPVRGNTEIKHSFGVLNALGIIAFAFRGHNLILEIQATMPSDEKHPSSVPMWKGVRVSYTIIAACLFPLAVGGYWAYGQLIPESGVLSALYAFHSRDVSRAVLGLTSLFVIVNAVSSFQIYAMPMFDYMESNYTIRKKEPCPWWLRAVFRAMFGYGCFFLAVAVPFLGSLAGLIGGLALPVTLAYPCFMWLKIKKPKMYSGMWWLNWVLGVLGMALSGTLVAAGVYVVIDTGIEASFFKPQ